MALVLRLIMAPRLPVPPSRGSRLALALATLSLGLAGCVKHEVEIAVPTKRACSPVTAFAAAPAGYPVRLANRTEQEDALAKDLAGSGWSVRVDELGYIARATRPASSAVGANGAATWSDEEKQQVESFVARTHARLGLRGAQLQAAPYSYSTSGKAALALVPAELAPGPGDPHDPLAGLPPAVVARKEYVGGGPEGDRFELQITGHGLVGLTLPEVHAQPEEVLRRWGKVHRETEQVPQICDFGCDGGALTLQGAVGRVVLRPMVLVFKASETEVELRRAAELVVDWTSEPYVPSATTASVRAQCLPWAVDLVTGEGLFSDKLLLELPDARGDWAGAASP